MFEEYLEFIKKETFSLDQDQLQDELLIEKSGTISIYYAPFDYVNTTAKIVICGITPGFQQAILALKEAGRQLRAGATASEAKVAAKKTASFGGSMRGNLVRLLNFIGIPPKLGINSSSDLFGDRTDLVHYTSALRFPVFKSNKNYSGSPSMISNDLLRNQIEQNLIPEISSLNSSTIYIPLGPKVEEALNFSADRGAIKYEQILSGLPHPSGANAERISYFLNEKPAKELSIKTNPQKLDEARAKIMEKMRALKT